MGTGSESGAGIIERRMPGSVEPAGDEHVAPHERHDLGGGLGVDLGPAHPRIRRQAVGDRPGVGRAAGNVAERRVQHDTEHAGPVEELTVGLRLAMQVTDRGAQIGLIGFGLRQGRTPSVEVLEQLALALHEQQERSAEPDEQAPRDTGQQTPPGEHADARQHGEHHDQAHEAEQDAAHPRSDPLLPRLRAGIGQVDLIVG